MHEAALLGLDLQVAEVTRTDRRVRRRHGLEGQPGRRDCHADRHVDGSLSCLVGRGPVDDHRVALDGDRDGELDQVVGDPIRVDIVDSSPLTVRELGDGRPRQTLAVVTDLLHRLKERVGSVLIGDLAQSHVSGVHR